ncbi:MAG: MarR family transcriptional regulator [Chloroflexi bacterium]|nr:MarR family transcriptional regulator [Chloroflexota bacterium]
MAIDLQHDKNEGSRTRLEYGDKDYDLWMRLNLAVAAILKARIPDMAESGLTYPEYALLGIVEWLGGSATQAELARWLMRTPQSISELANRMERRGLVKRKRSAKNWRTVTVFFLPRGRDAFHRTVERDPIRNVMRLSQDEYATLWSLLGKLMDQSLAHGRRQKEAGDEGM